MDGETEESASCEAEAISTGAADDDYITRLQQDGAWDEEIDTELSKILSLQEIRDSAASSAAAPDAAQLSSSSDATCVADAVRRASESLSPKPFSNIWEQGVFGAIFTGDMSEWLSTFDSSLHRLVEPPDFASNGEPDVHRKDKRARVANRTFSKVIAADHDETWQESRQEQLEAGVHKMVDLVGSWTQCETADILNSSSSFDAKEQVMSDILAGRAPATIAKRGRSLEKVTMGVMEMGHSFPCSERAFYEFLCRERSKGAPCSRL
jgi:hypothetical protein